MRLLISLAPGPLPAVSPHVRSSLAPLNIHVCLQVRLESSHIARSSDVYRPIIS